MSAKHTDDSTRMRQLFIRVPDNLIAAIDHYEKRLAAEQPWTPISRSDAVRRLLHKGLEAVAAEDAGRMPHVSTTVESPPPLPTPPTPAARLAAEDADEKPHTLTTVKVFPPESTPPPLAVPAPEMTESTDQPPPPRTQRRPRGPKHQDIIALLQNYPDGLTPVEIAAQLHIDKPMKDILQKMAKRGALRRVGVGRYAVLDSETV